MTKKKNATVHRYPTAQPDVILAVIVVDGVMSIISGNDATTVKGALRAALANITKTKQAADRTGEEKNDGHLPVP